MHSSTVLHATGPSEVRTPFIAPSAIERPVTVVCRRSTPPRCSARSSTFRTSAERSETGNTRLPRDLERAAALLKKGHCRFRREGRHGAVEEAPVARNIFQRLFGGAGICDIAAALAGEEELFAAAAVFFEQEYPTPARGGLNCGKQPCRSPAHDHGVKCGLFHRHGTDPRPAPDARASARSRACGGTSARRSGR